VRAPAKEWRALADGDERLENALARLHVLFKDADTLGSLIDPKRSTEITHPSALQTSTDDVGWQDLAPLLIRARSEQRDPASSVLGSDAAGLARAAAFLAQRYTLLVTNVPFLTRGKQQEALRKHLERAHKAAGADLASAMFDRMMDWCTRGGMSFVVCPEKVLYLSALSVGKAEFAPDLAEVLKEAVRRPATSPTPAPSARCSRASGPGSPIPSALVPGGACRHDRAPLFLGLVAGRARRA
jgi:hypothetical protein